jgi:hypothetical protein
MASKDAIGKVAYVESVTGLDFRIGAIEFRTGLDSIRDCDSVPWVTVEDSNLFEYCYVLRSIQV